MARFTLILFAALAVMTTAAMCHRPGAKQHHGVYVSLGDSIAAGNGASDPATTSFVALVAKDEGVRETLNLAVSGATSKDVIDKQLPQLLGKTEGKKIDFITIAVGGNDLAALIPNASCRDDPPPATCPLATTLDGVNAHLTAIMQRLRSWYPNTPIVLLAYPNLFSGTGHPFEAPAARVLPRLDETIRGVAAFYPHTSVAEAPPAFEGKGAELTHVLDPQFDPHPNDAGHRAIADAFEAALAKIE